MIVDGGSLGEEDENARAGSTVIDLTLPGSYKIVREGSHYAQTAKILNEECKMVKR
jgi:tRNA A37 threonylcarbamoyladenosine synthetase subunit TsaC/SUA5/YrdC